MIYRQPHAGFDISDECEPERDTLLLIIYSMINKQMLQPEPGQKLLRGLFAGCCLLVLSCNPFIQGAEMTAAVRDTDRKAIGDFVRQYGEAWKDGLAVLERDFNIAIKGSRGKFRIDCSPKSDAGWDARVDLSIGKNHRMMFSIKIPDGEEPGQQEKDLVDRALANLKQVWVLDPVMINPVKTSDDAYSSPPVPIVIDLSRGLDGLKDHYAVTWRKRNQHPVLYLSAQEIHWESFSIAFDSRRGRILELIEKSLPQKKIRFLSPEEHQEIESALKKHGDFGVYGRVDRNLESLRKEFNMSIAIEPSRIHVRLTPHSGRGHDFSFAIDRKTGMIDDVAVGELMPPD